MSLSRPVGAVAVQPPTARPPARIATTAQRPAGGRAAQLTRDLRGRLSIAASIGQVPGRATDQGRRPDQGSPTGNRRFPSPDPPPGPGLVCEASFVADDETAGIKVYGIKVYGAPWCPDCRRTKKF